MLKFWKKNKDLRVTYSYNDVSLVPAYSELKSRSDSNPSQYGYKLPIIGSCMDVFNYKMMIKLMHENIPFIVHRSFRSPVEQFMAFTTHMDKDELSLKEFNKCVWFAVGSMQKYKDWIEYLYDKGIRRFCVDMAHGDSKACIDTIKFIKELDYKNKSAGKYNTAFGVADFPVHVIAGNVASLEGFLRLQKAGADGIRVGVASGSICSTCLETGMGVPILTNIMDIAPYKKNTWLIADGGASHTGDIAKAIYFGADFVMMGKMLAATDLATGDCYNSHKEELLDLKLNCPEAYFSCVYPHNFEEKYEHAKKLDWEQGNADNKFKEMCIRNVVKYKSYHGMASRDARKNVLSYASVEGRSGLIEYNCTTNQFIHDTYLRLQASLSYGGAHNWVEFRKNVKAVRRSQAGIAAGKTHLDVLFDK